MNLLRDRLASGAFILTGEVAPPKGPDLAATRERARAMADHVDAINITDNQRAVMRMANLAVAGVLESDGIETILQITSRDRNRIALQSDLLAAWALGVRNVLCLTGDPVSAGPQPEAKAVFDLSSVGLLETVSALNQGVDLVGTPLTAATDLVPGAVVNPNLPKLSGQIRWLRKKIEAGARFIQTQAIYDVAQFLRFKAEAGPIAVPLIGGILLIKNAKMAHFLANFVPGVVIPPAVIARFENARDEREEGLRLAVETADALRPHVAGIHLMSVGQERTLAELAAEIRRRYKS